MLYYPLFLFRLLLPERIVASFRLFGPVCCSGFCVFWIVPESFEVFQFLLEVLGGKYACLHDVVHTMDEKRAVENRRKGHILEYRVAILSRYSLRV